MLIRIRVQSVVNLVFFLILYIWSGSQVYTLIPNMSLLLIPIALLCSVYLCCRYAKRKTYPLYVCAVIQLILMIVCTCVADFGAGIIDYIKKVSFVIVAFTVVEVIDFPTVCRIFRKAMTAIAIISLIGYVLANYTSAPEYIPRMKNINGTTYCTIGIYGFIQNIPHRNCGIFWEPGVYATFLVIAMVVEIFFNERPVSLPRLVLYTITLLTANSSAGFALLFLCFVLYYVSTMQKSLSVLRIFFVFILALLIANYEIVLNIVLELFDGYRYIAKLQMENVKGSERFLALAHNLGIFMSKPVFGAGMVEVANKMMHIADTSTTTYMLSVYGFAGISFTAYLMIGVMRQKKIDMSSRLIMALIFLIIINKEPHETIMFTWCFMFHMLSSNEWAHYATRYPEKSGQELAKG